MKFLDILDSAVGKVLETHPNAKFYEAHTPVGDPMMTAPDVKDVIFVFLVEEGSTGMIRWTNGEFGPIALIPMPWLQDEIIELPLAFDLADAIQCMRLAEINCPFVCATLRKPLYPGVKEASYIFGCPDIGAHVFVGVESHEVTRQVM